MSDSNAPPLRFDPIDGLTVRGDFDGGALSPDVGPLLLRSVDQQIGLTKRLAAAIGDRRHVRMSVIKLPICWPSICGSIVDT